MNHNINILLLEDASNLMFYVQWLLVTLHYENEVGIPTRVAY